MLAGLAIASLLACEPDAGPLGLVDATVPVDAAVPADGGPPDAEPEPTCAVDNGGCDPEAECTRSRGEIGCACPSFWIGDGWTCLEPLLSRVDALIKSPDPEPSEWFGDEVAISGDGRTVAIGATLEDGPDDAEDAGAVYVYRRDGEDWALDARLVSPTPTLSARFGDALALDADGLRLAVGESQVVGSRPASVVIFTRAEQDWRVEAELVAPPPGSLNGALDLTPDGQWLAVGARGATADGVPAAGAAFRFRRSGTAWSSAGEVTAPNPGREDLFGDRVALSANGQTLAIGVQREDSGSAGIAAELDAEPSLRASGAVYVFRDAGNGLELDVFIKSPEPRVEQRFARSLALNDAGDTLGVGSRGERLRGPGAAYVYRRRDDAGWSLDTRLEGSDGSFSPDQDDFGIDVSLSAAGDVVAVGAFSENTPARGVSWPSNADGESKGAVFLFRRFDGAWSLDSFAKPTNPGDGTFFAVDVAMSADAETLVVGRAFDDGDGAGLINDPPLEDLGPGLDDAGAAYIFR